MNKEFLYSLLDSMSVSGHEIGLQKKVIAHMTPYCDVEMDKDEDPMVCHEIIDDLERECFRQHGVHLVIHYDPVVVNDPELERMRTLVTAILKVKDERLGIHDFRMVPGAGHTNLIFDVELPLNLRGQEKTIQAALETALNDLGEGTYYTVITFD